MQFVVVNVVKNALLLGVKCLQSVYLFLFQTQNKYRDKLKRFNRDIWFDPIVCRIINY